MLYRVILITFIFVEHVLLDIYYLNILRLAWVPQMLIERPLYFATDLTVRIIFVVIIYVVATVLTWVFFSPFDGPQLSKRVLPYQLTVLSFATLLLISVYYAVKHYVLAVT
jgi:hypothetical protein